MTAPKKSPARKPSGSAAKKPALKAAPPVEKPAAPAPPAAGGKVLPFRGRDYRLPDLSQGDLPLETMEALEDGKVATVVRGLLGPVQWAQLKASTPPPTAGDLGELMEQISAAYGFASAGESAASSD